MPRRRRARDLGLAFALRTTQLERAIRTDDPALQLLPASGRSRGWLFAITVGMPVVATLLGVVLGRIPVGATLWGTGHRGGDASIAVLVVAVATGAIALFLDRMLKRHRLQFDAGGLDIATTFYRQRLALSELQLDAARVVRFDEHPELGP